MMAAVNNLMRRPLSTRDFVKKENFDQEIYGRLNRYDEVDGQSMPSTVILTGKSGVGKSESALQLSKRYKRDNRNLQILNRTFNADSIPALINDLVNFNQDMNLQMQTLEQMQRRENLGQIFEELFNVLNTKFPEHIKFLTFDDAEQSTSIVKHINDYVCEGTQDDLHKKWKIIITTQDDHKNEWLAGCDYLSIDNFIHIGVFDQAQTNLYLTEVKGLTAHHRNLLHDKLGGLPLALRVAREYLTSNTLHQPEEYLNQFFRDLEQLDPQDPIVSSLHLSMIRLVESLPHPDLAKDLLKLISMLDEKNVMPDVLTALAEVVITEANGRVNPRTQAQVLSNKLIEGLISRHLCDVIDTAAGRLMSLHQLVKKGALMFSQDDTPNDKRLLARLCLVALTRVTPKDGRGHNSHVVHSYMHRHGRSVANHIEVLRRENILTRQNSPAALLLYSNLLSSMTYCLLAQRTPIQEAKPLLVRALNVFSSIFTGEDYNRFRIPHKENPTDSDRATHLLGEIGRQTSPLFNNDEYSIIVGNLSPHHRLTEKDLKNMIDFERVHDIHHYLQDGHINRLYLMELTNRGMIVGAPIEESIYPLEVLIEIYYVWLRVPYFTPGDCAFNERAQQCGRAAQMLCEHVRGQHAISLMTEVIIERDLLTLDMKIGNRDPAEILAGYNTLMGVGNDETRKYGYEYGIRRTNFEHDNYHKLLCKENKASCYGKLCKQTSVVDANDAGEHFIRGDNEFQDLVRESREFPNNRTLSTTYRKYAAFLSECEKPSEAVRKLLDAMIYFNSFLKNKAPDGTDYPEQNNCGKFTDYYSELGKYYNEWKMLNPNTSSTMLTVDGSDDPRIDYIQGFMAHYYERYHRPQHPNQADSPSKYGIMECLIPRQRLPEEDQAYVDDAELQPADEYVQLQQAQD